MAEAGSGVHVLVIEDDPLVQRVLRMQLGARGHRVSIGRDGVEGFAAALELRPDVVVLDLMMPRMSGFEVLERLRSHASLAELPVLVLTASLNDAHRAELLGHRANAYLTKPYLEADLHGMIESLLQRA